MISKIVIFILSLAALYHTYSFGAYLAKSGEKKTALSVYAFVFLAGALLVVVTVIR